MGAKITEARKASHIDVCIRNNVQFRKKTAGFEDVELIHCALPECSLQNIDTSTDFFGKRLKLPFVIEAVTGGYREAEAINKKLAAAAQEKGVAMGVGSQRAMIEDSSLSHTYSVRDVAPDIFLMGNIGLSQLKKIPPSKVASAISKIGADALAIHLNSVQEAFQPEGEVDFSGGLKVIEKLCSELSIPVIAKEVGAGISAECALKLESAGVSAIDIAGAGGTSWSGVELLRSGNHFSEEFWDWGIPTVVSLVEVVNSTELPVISSGGLRSGVDAAKSIALGADLAGAAFPFLKAAIDGETKGAEKVSSILADWERDLRLSMFLTGSKNLEKLNVSSVLIKGKTAERLAAYGLSGPETRE